MKLLDTFTRFSYVRIPEYNLVIWFDDSPDNELRKWSSNKSATHLRQITKENYETITHTFKWAYCLH